MMNKLNESSMFRPDHTEKAPQHSAMMNCPRAMQEKLQAMRFLQDQRQQERNRILQQNPDILLEVHRLKQQQQVLHQQQQQPIQEPQGLLLLPPRASSMAAVPQTILSAADVPPAPSLVEMVPTLSSNPARSHGLVPNASGPIFLTTRAAASTPTQVTAPHHRAVSAGPAMTGGQQLAFRDDSWLEKHHALGAAPRTTPLQPSLHSLMSHVAPSVHQQHQAPTTLSQVMATHVPSPALVREVSLGDTRFSPPSAVPLPNTAETDTLSVIADAIALRSKAGLSDMAPSHPPRMEGAVSVSAPPMPVPIKNTETVKEAPLKEADSGEDDDEGEQKAEEGGPSSAKQALKPKQARVGVRKESQWLSTYEDLIAYKNEFGDCLVPRGFSPSPQLASWVAEQRKQFKRFQQGIKTTLTQERIDLLNELDFAWNAQEAAWNNHYANLLKYKEQFGHCHVPLADTAIPKLGLWCKEQRRHFGLMHAGRPTHMNEERVQKLNGIGFCWDTHEATWLGHFHALAQYKERYGDCRVPEDWPLNPGLGAWVVTQRRQRDRKAHKKNCLTADRVKKLESLGFEWFSNGSAEPNQLRNRKRSQSEEGLGRVVLKPRFGKRRRI